MLPRYSIDFITASVSAKGKQEAEMVRTLGAGLAEKVIASETNIKNVENKAVELRALLEQAIGVAVEGDMAAGEELAANAASSLENIVKQVGELCLTAEETRRAWVEYRRRLNEVITSASRTTASLDLAVARA
ncbi:hypothetical protein AX15_002863, partial [Amanita polypyramis BW_CC]